MDRAEWIKTIHTFSGRHQTALSESGAAGGWYERNSQNNDGTVWKTLFSLLEIRMQKGEFTVIDATNSKTSELNRYKNMCETYRYRMYCVDFTDIPIEGGEEKKCREGEFKRVSDDVIDKMYSRFATQKIPSGITVIKPDELDSIWMKKRDFSQYKRIHHIGDVHGCYTALMKYLDDNGGIKDDEFYIFTGDYIDRGSGECGGCKFPDIYHGQEECSHA